MDKYKLATNYCLSRFNDLASTDKEAYLRQFARVINELNSKDPSSYSEICEFLDPKISIRHNPFLLGKNPLREDREEITDLEALLERGIEDITDLEEQVKGKTVFIKPNLNFVPGDINPYGMTDPRLLIALTKVLHRYGAKILIGEKPGQKRKSADSYDLLRQHFQIPDYVRFIEIDEEKRVETSTSTNLVSSKLELPESYLDADYFIDIPKMKTHTLTGVSLGVKNLFGLLTDEEKMKHHNENINQKLVDLLSVRLPNLTIIDGLIALEGQGPLYGTPKNSNVLIVGKDCVSTDAVASYLMGFDPKEVPYLDLAYKMGLGDINIDNFNFLAEKPVLRMNFKKGNCRLNPFSQIKIEYGKNVPQGYLNALSHSLERLKHEEEKPEEVKVYVGEFPKGKIVEENSIIFGDITAQTISHQSQKIILGHPPSAFELYSILKNQQK